MKTRTTTRTTEITMERDEFRVVRGIGQQVEGGIGQQDDCVEIERDSDLMTSDDAMNPPRTSEIDGVKEKMRNDLTANQSY